MDKQSEIALAKKVGKSIAYKRKVIRLTQDDLAQKLGLGIEAISRMERGQIMPSIPRLVEVAEALECPVPDLLLLASERAMDYSVQFAEKLRQLHPEDRDMLLEIVNRLARRLAN
jgi:transcriptional regulator with XRE-family HTH domain